MTTATTATSDTPTAYAEMDTISAQVRDAGRNIATWAGLPRTAPDILEQVERWAHQCGYVPAGRWYQPDPNIDLQRLPLTPRTGR